jgi:hypothetical protein
MAVGGWFLVAAVAVLLLIAAELVVAVLEPVGQFAAYVGRWFVWQLLGALETVVRA